MTWQMVAWIGGSNLPDADEDGFVEVRHWKVYLDEEFASKQLQYSDGERFSQDTYIDVKNGVYGPNAYTDEITLEEMPT